MSVSAAIVRTLQYVEPLAGLVCNVVLMRCARRSSSIVRGLALPAAELLAPDGLQMTWLVTMEREGADKPVCVAESVTRNYGAAP